MSRFPWVLQCKSGLNLAPWIYTGCKSELWWWGNVRNQGLSDLRIDAGQWSEELFEAQHGPDFIVTFCAALVSSLNPQSPQWQNISLMKQLWGRLLWWLQLEQQPSKLRSALIHSLTQCFTLTCVYTPHINSGLVNKCSCFGIHDAAVRHLYSSVTSLNEYLQDIQVTEDVVVSVVVHSWCCSIFSPSRWCPGSCTLLTICAWTVIYHIH